MELIYFKTMDFMSTYFLIAMSVVLNRILICYFNYVDWSCYILGLDRLFLTRVVCLINYMTGNGDDEHAAGSEETVLEKNADGSLVKCSGSIVNLL